MVKAINDVTNATTKSAAGTENIAARSTSMVGMAKEVTEQMSIVNGASENPKNLVEKFRL